MIAKKATSQGKAARVLKTEYSRVAAVTLIVTLVVGLFVIPQAAALESGDGDANETARFSSQAAAIEYYLEMAERNRGDPETVSFSSQADAIDFYLAELRSDRADVASVSFSSQAAAIDSYLAQLECDRAEVAGSSFSSQAAAIDYYLALAQRDRLEVADASLPLACSLVN